jgi:2-polyprenyl-3-methyl-5-hydroxy-6-metoxy-1,4-benzoquinol methylase
MWFYDKICRVARECVGVDIQCDIVKKLKMLGYNVVCDNAEKVTIGRKFDVIVAERLFEHLSNQGIFLENMKKHLKSGGIMILTAPNMFCPRYILWKFFGKFEELNMDPEHTLWHSEETLKEIVERHRWKVKEVYYSYIRPRSRWKKAFTSVVSHLISPRYIGTIIVAVLEKK